MSPPLHSALPCWALNPESPKREQFDSAREDAEEKMAKPLSALDAELDAQYGQGDRCLWVPSSDILS